MFIKKIPSIKLPISEKFELRNKTFVSIGRVKSVIKIMSCTSGAKTCKIMGVYRYTSKYHKPFETDEKLKVAKQTSSKTSFAPYQAQSSVLWWQPSYQQTMGVMISMTKIDFSIFNRLNFHFQGIHSIIPVLYSCGFW